MLVDRKSYIRSDTNQNCLVGWSEIPPLMHPTSKTKMPWKCFPTKHITWASGRHCVLQYSAGICILRNPTLSSNLLFKKSSTFTPSKWFSEKSLTTPVARPSFQASVLSRSNSFRCQKQYATSPPHSQPGNGNHDKIKTQLKWWQTYITSI